MSPTRIRWLSALLLTVLLLAMLSGSARAIPQAVSYSGRVIYTPKTGGNWGQPGVIIQLWAVDGHSNLTLLTSTVTNSQGNWSLLSNLVPPNGYRIVKVDPPGFIPDYIYSPFGGEVLDINTLSVGPPMNLSGVYFGIKDPEMGNPVYHDRYLIVTSIMVTPALEDFMTYKQSLGFDMQVITVEALDPSGQGGNFLRSAIRDYEKKLYGEPEGLKYVLLIGTNSTVPFMTYNPGGMDLSRSSSGKFPDDCAGIPFEPNNCGWAGDWYYVDLTSDWDSNLDGVLGEAFWAIGSDEVISYTLKHPGYVPDNPPLFLPDVYVGRLMIDDPGTAQSTLANIMRFERDGGDWKRNTLLAGAMQNYAGQGWSTEKNAYYDLGPNTDSALLNEELWKILSQAGMSRLTTYEKDSPPTINKPPNDFPVDLPLTQNNFRVLWAQRKLGFVNASGHGSPSGIYRRYWMIDTNKNGIVDNPLPPPEPQCCTLWELSSPPFLDSGDYAYFNYSHSSDSDPVLMSMACEPGKWTQPSNLATSLLVNNAISAFIGESSSSQFEPYWDDPKDGGAASISWWITSSLFEKHRSLGDAVWEGLETYFHITNGSKWHLDHWDWGFINWVLYGDPSMRYYGNTSDSSAPWPMYHADWPGTGSTPLLGPGASVDESWAKKIGALDNDDTQNSSPVIGRDGTIYIGDVDGDVSAFWPDGSTRWVYYSINPPQFLWRIHTAPAVAFDGTVYVKTDQMLLALYPDGSLKWEKVVGDGQGSAKIGPDGLIYFGASVFPFPGGIKRYTLVASNPTGVPMNLGHPDATYTVDSPITTAASFDQDGRVWVGTESGSLYSIIPSDDLIWGMVLTPGYSLGHGLAIREGDDPLVFVPSSSGELIAWSVNEMQARWNWKNTTEHPAIWGAPAYATSPSDGSSIPPSTGQVYFGSEDGVVTALDAEDGSLIWAKEIGGPIYSAPAVDPQYVYIMAGSSPGKLYILRRSDGAVTSEGSFIGSSAASVSPAIGFGRMIYTAGQVELDFKLVAFSQAASLPAPSIGTFVPAYHRIDLYLKPGDPTRWMQVESRLPGGQWQISGNLPPGETYFAAAPLGVTTEFRARTMLSAPLAPAAISPSALAPTQNSDYSSIVAVDALPDPPVTPPAPRVSPLSSTELRLTFPTLPAGSTFVTVLRKGPRQFFFTPRIRLPANTPAFVDNDLLPNTLYIYELQVDNAGGDSLPGPSASASTLPQTLPAPGNISVRVLGTATFRICWSPGASGVKTVIGRQPLGQATPDILATLPAGVTCYDDANAYNYGFHYWLKHIEPRGLSDSPWAISDLVLAKNFLLGSLRIFLPFIRR